MLFTFTLYLHCFLADTFIQSDLQMRTIEVKINKRAMICKCYIIIVLYFSFTKTRAAFRPSNNKRTHFIYNLSYLILLKSWIELNHEIKIVNRIELWVEWIVTSLTIILLSSLIKVITLVFFAHKKYCRSFIKLQLNYWCCMDYFIDVLTTFLGLERGSCVAVDAGSESIWISSKIS